MTLRLPLPPCRYRLRRPHRPPRRCRTRRQGRPAAEPLPFAFEVLPLDPFALEPFAFEPLAFEPSALEPFAFEPFALEPFAPGPFAFEPLAEVEPEFAELLEPPVPLPEEPPPDPVISPDEPPVPDMPEEPAPPFAPEPPMPEPFWPWALEAAERVSDRLALSELPRAPDAQAVRRIAAYATTSTTAAIATTARLRDRTSPTRRLKRRFSIRCCTLTRSCRSFAGAFGRAGLVFSDRSSLESVVRAFSFMTNVSYPPCAATVRQTGLGVRACMRPRSHGNECAMDRSQHGELVAGVFGGGDAARATAQALTAAGFTKPWIGEAGTSLRATLAGLGFNDAPAADVELATPAAGAVVVVDAGERADLAGAIVLRFGGSIFAADGRPPYDPRRTTSPAESVAGQGDELDRGTGEGASGGGLGATTGLWPEAPARRDREANAIDAGAMPRDDAHGN